MDEERLSQGDIETCLLLQEDCSRSRLGLRTTGKLYCSCRCSLRVLFTFCLAAVVGLLVFYRIDASFIFKLDSISNRTLRDSLNVLVVGDWGRRGQYNQSLVANQMGKVGHKLNIDFVISTGDNFYEGGLTSINDEAFEESFSKIYTAESLQKTWHNILGNHDYRGDVLVQLDPKLTQRDWRWHCERAFTLTYELGLPAQGTASSVQFFFYDTSPFVDHYWKPSKTHYDWRGVEPREKYLKQQVQDLRSDLDASKATWKIVVGHHPIRSIGAHGDTTELLNQIYPILIEAGVDLYINGHDHCLQHITRQESIIQFLTSGGGSKAYRGIAPVANLEGVQFYHDGQGFVSLSVAPTNLNISFYSVAGDILHKIDLSKVL